MQVYILQFQLCIVPCAICPSCGLTGEGIGKGANKTKFPHSLSLKGEKSSLIFTFTWGEATSSQIHMYIQTIQLYSPCILHRYHIRPSQFYYSFYQLNWISSALSPHTKERGKGKQGSASTHMLPTGNIFYKMQLPLPIPIQYLLCIKNGNWNDCSMEHQQR